MSFNFVNMDNKALRELIHAARDEERRRFLANVSNYPQPVITNAGGIEDIKRYYNVYKYSHNVGLLEAKLIVDYWNNRIMQGD